MEEPIIESILVADCGTVTTKLLLLERVEASYRFVAQAETLTTSNPPWHDVSVGVFYAIEELEEITKRTFFSQGRLITPRQGAEGVDAFVVLLSASEPLHIVLAGLIREASLESARRAAAGSYAVIDAMLSRENSLQSPQETWARTIRRLAPDIVFLVGGVDGGAVRPVLELAEAIALAVSMTEKNHRPMVLYAGNESLRPKVTKLLGKLTQVEVVDNVRPTADTEHLGPARQALETYYTENHMQNVPGADTLQRWSHLPLMPTAAAFTHVVNYLWHRTANEDRGTLGIDVGAGTTAVAATFEGRSYLTAYKLGLAFGPLQWLTEHELADLLRWIPEEIEEEELLAILYNRELRPWTVPQEPREQFVEQAVVREILRGALEVAQPTWNTGAAASEPGLMPRFDPILVSGGGLVHLPHPGRTLLIILDGLQPVGISTLLLDINRAAPALGAVASIKPLAATSALEAGTLVPLGTVISPTGKMRPDETILRMRIEYDDGGYLDVEARAGAIEVWPLLPGQKATLDIRPARRIDIGLGPGRGGKVQAIGGKVGLVVDARGRPLKLPDDPDLRRRLLNGWIWDVGG